MENIQHDYFIWEENSYIEQKKNDKNNNESVHCDTITKTKNDSTQKDWRDITDPKERKKAYKKAWHQENKERLKIKSKIYREVNKETIKIKKKIYSKANKEKENARKKKWRAENLDKVLKQNRKRKKERRKEDIQYKLCDALRHRLYIAINNNQKKGSAVKDLGCTIPELKVYLESKFQPGMTWDNWTIDGWHIDHIKPLSNFDLTDRKQFLEACHYTNLQPLWAKDNLIKRDKLI